MWCEKPSNCQLEYTQHGGLTCKSTGRTRRPARLQPACSARRPARRWVVCTRVACHHPSVVCHQERPKWMLVSGKVPGRFDPDSAHEKTKSQLLLSLSTKGKPVQIDEY